MKRIISLLLTILMMFSVVSVAPFSVGAEETEPTEPINIIKQGSCGLSAYYTLDDKGELVVSGTGELIYYDYNGIYGYYFDVPWYYIRNTIKTVIIQNGITRINEYAFFDCNNLKSITILNPDCSICDSDLTISDTAIICGDDNSTAQQYAEKYGRTFVSLSEKTFDYTYNVLPDGTAEITGYTGIDTSLTIPSEIDGYTVTSIGEGAFDGCTGLTSVTIPDSVTSIGECAFDCCTDLTSIDIPDSVTYIGVLAFQCCKSLTSIDIPDSVVTIDFLAFSGCTGLTSIDVPDSVQSIGSYAFEACSGITSVTFGNSVESIGAGAFFCCSGLTSINIPDSVVSIGADAFSCCSGLTSITIGNSVESIGKYAFVYCETLTSITILNPDCSIDDDSLTISDNATIYGYDNSTAQVYAEKHGRTFVSLSEQTTDYTYSMLSDGTAEITGYTGTDTNLTIPSKIDGYTVTSIGEGAFFGCSGLTSITIPDSVVSIGAGAFDTCTDLTSVTIPNSVTSIGGFAFGFCISLASIIIPDSVTSIEKLAFADCTNLAEVVILNPDCEIGLDVETIPSTATIYGYRVSTAQEYTEKYSKKFIVLDAEEPTEAPTVEPTEEPTEAPSEEAVQVQNITGEATPNTVTLTWDLIEGIEKYWIYMYNDATDVWSTMISAYPGESSASGLVKNLIPNTTYKFKVTGRYAADKTYLSLDDAQVIEITTAPPAAPTTLSASLGMGEATISWDPVEGADKYWIYKSKSEDSGYYISNSSLTNSALMINLKPNTTYYFRITSRTYQNGIPCVSDVMDSPVISVTMPSKEDLATHVPTNTSTTAHVTWSPLANADVDKVWVQYSKIAPDTTIAANWTTATSLTGDVTSCSITRLEPDTVYHITVRARYVDASGVTKSYFYTPKTIRTAYSDESFLNFRVQGNFTIVTLPDDINDAEKVWVYAYDQDGNQKQITSPSTKEALFRTFEGIEDCYFVVEVRNSNGYYTYLTPPGGEKYHT